MSARDRTRFPVESRQHAPPSQLTLGIPPSQPPAECRHCGDPAVPGLRVCRRCWDARRAADRDQGARPDRDLTHARPISLHEGERVEGCVARLPTPGTPDGTRLSLDCGGEMVAFSATAARGWVVFERELADQHVRAGDRIAVTFLGWRATKDGERRYRAVRLEVLERAR
jgi:hypothetical protein